MIPAARTRVTVHSVQISTPALLRSYHIRYSRFNLRPGNAEFADDRRIVGIDDLRGPPEHVVAGLRDDPLGVARLADLVGVICTGYWSLVTRTVFELVSVRSGTSEGRVKEAPPLVPKSALAMRRSAGS